MNKVRKVQILLADGGIKECLIEYSESPPWTLSVSGLELDKRQFVGSDLFEALVKLRMQLEEKELQLLCAGARPNVTPSGMSRGMGGGLRAYVTQIGKPARQSDLMNIFEYASPEAIGSVREQHEFHEAWAESLRRL